MEQSVRRMWEHFTIKKAWTRSVLVDAEKERQEGTEGDWQQESVSQLVRFARGQFAAIRMNSREF